MANKEESSFLQGVESRLDSLFGEDPKPVKEKDNDVPLQQMEKVAADLKPVDFGKTQILKVTNHDAEISSGEPALQDQSSVAGDAKPAIDEDLRDIPPLTETSVPSAIPSETVKVQDRSAFISEIEKRFSAIFGEDDKDAGAVKQTEDKSGLEEIKESDPTLEEVLLPPSDVLQSHLKDLKSIVLSLEWEINDQILEQFEDEVNQLHLFYTGDHIIQGLLRILRFVGRYVRVKGASSNQDTINLLMSVYDHLEGVMVTEGITESGKRIFLMESIKHYQSWVENADIESPSQSQVSEAPVEEMKPLEMERPEEEFQKEPKEEFATIEVAEEKSFAEVGIDQPVGDALSLRETAGEDQIEWVSRQPVVPAEAPDTPVDEILPPARSEDEERIIAAMKELPPHEAFVYAFDELKKTFQAEINALKEEIRLLKSGG